MDLSHEVTLQTTLRDQFKSFVRENMDVFDYEKCDMNQSFATNNKTIESVKMASSRVSPIDKRRTTNIVNESGISLLATNYKST